MGCWTELSIRGRTERYTWIKVQDSQEQGFGYYLYKKPDQEVASALQRRSLQKGKRKIPGLVWKQLAETAGAGAGAVRGSWSCLDWLNRTRNWNKMSEK